MLASIDCGLSSVTTRRESGSREGKLISLFCCSAVRQSAAQLLAMIDSGAIRWCSSLQLHEFIIDPSRCDRPDDDDEEGHGGRHRRGGSVPTGPRAELLSGLPPPPPAVAAAAAPLAVEAGGVVAAVDFSFAELFARIGGFRVGLEACGGH